MKTALRVLSLLACLAGTLSAQNATLQWLTRKNGPGNAQDYGNSVALDASGNVVIAGDVSYPGGIGSGLDVYTAKYDGTNGGFIWDAHYNSPNNTGDEGKAVTVDSAGNVLVTGTSFSNNFSDYYTVKFSPLGVLLWQKIYDGPGHGQDIPVAVAVDAAGNVCVTGSSVNAAGHNGIYTVKYAAGTGNPMWEKRYDLAGGLDAGANALAVDSAGNVIIAGNSDTSRYTAKYAANTGALVWEVIGDPGADANFAVAVGASGDVAVTGVKFGAGIYDFYTAKYAAADGALLWEKSLSRSNDLFEIGFAVVMDAAGNVCVAGQIGSNTHGLDLYTVKYSSDFGDVVWEQTYNGPGNGDDQAAAIGLDSSGNVIIGGTSVGLQGNSDYYVAKYATGDGHLLWQARYNGPANVDDFLTGLKVTSDGGAVVTGYIDDNQNSNPDIATIRFAPPTDLATQPPTLLAPPENSTQTTPIVVTYHLPETAEPGSVEIKFHDFTHGVEVFLTPNAAGETVGDHTYNIIPANPGTSTGIVHATGGAITDGSYTVLISYQDTTDNPRQYDYHFNVTIDNTPPDTVATGPSGTVSSPDANIQFVGNEFNCTFTATLDGNDLGTVTSPYVVTGLADGPHTFSVAAKDVAGNVDPTPFVLNWTVATEPTDPVFAALYSKGGAVPNAGPGGDPKIQDGAAWSGFGNPAVNDNGDVAFLGKWKAPAQKTPVPFKAQSGIGIFVNDELLVKVGDPVPGLGGDLVFKGFKAPVIDNHGHVAFLAGIKGTGVISTNDTVVVTNGRDGNLEILAREGGTAPGTGGAAFKGFSNVSIKAGAPVVITTRGALPAPTGSDSGIVFTATLVQGSGTPAVTSASDAGAWWLPADGSSLQLVTRESETHLFAAGSVKTFTLLKPVSGSAGQGRGQINGSALSLFATNTDHSLGIFTIPGGGAPFAAALAGDLIGSAALPNARWAKLSLPSTDDTGQVRTMLASLQTGPGGTPSAQAKGIFQSLDGGLDWEPIIRTGDSAAFEFGTGAVFGAFKDPVNAPDCESVAFVATIKGGTATTATNDGVWFAPDGAAPILIAREGDEPPGAPGAKWKSFSSLALPGGDEGPLFTAALLKGPAGSPGPGGITGATDFALYRSDFSGHVIELIREGQPLLGKTVKNFSVLKASAGAAGTTRAFNNGHQVVLLVAFTDNSTAIVAIQLPDSLPPL